MGQTPTSHANYEGLNVTPLQARIEATVTHGFGYSDRSDFLKSYLYKPDVRSQVIGNDNPQNLQNSLLSLDLRSGVNLKYVTLDQSPTPRETFFSPDYQFKKNKGPLGNLSDRLRLLAATTRMSFASLSETTPYHKGSAFTKDITPHDEGLKPFSPRYPIADDETCHIPGTPRVGGIDYLDNNCNKLPPRGEELEPVIGKNKIFFIDPDPDTALRRMLERAEFEEPQTCDWRSAPVEESNLSPFHKPFVETSQRLLDDNTTIPQSGEHPHYVSLLTPDPESELRLLLRELEEEKRQKPKFSIEDTINIPARFRRPNQKP